MKKIEVVYSPLCEANGAFIGRLKKWLENTDVQIQIIPYDKANKNHNRYENCFIDLYYNDKIIDTVPLNREKIFKALELEDKIQNNHIASEGSEANSAIIKTAEELKCLVLNKQIVFFPITKENYLEEMSMCLCNYPFGNPPQAYHKDCISIKSKVFDEALQKEKIAGVYAKYKDKVIGLIEAFPRQLLKKYGYMTGGIGNDEDYISIGCYEIGYGIPRIQMLDELMNQLLMVSTRFSRKYIEGIGIYEWNEGFNPYWVYEKYSFKRVEVLDNNTVVMQKALK